MVGIYTDANGKSQGFYIDETDGTWGTATPAPGLAALNVGGLGYLNSVACPAAGACVAEGEYVDAAGHSQVVVESQAGGVWGTAQPLPGLSSLNKGDAFARDVSCPAPGSCELGGEFQPSSGHTAPFVAAESSGLWHDARPVRGLRGLGGGIGPIVCAAVGSCIAGGSYEPVDGYHTRAFVMIESAGVWGRPQSVPGLNAVDTGKGGSVTGLSCGAIGNCAIVGNLVAGTAQLGFVANERHGVWFPATEVSGVTNARMDTVSCAAADICVAGGSPWGGSPPSAFVVTEPGNR